MRALGAVGGGLGFALSFPPFDVTWLGWVALVPLLLAIRGVSGVGSALLGALFALTAVLGLVSWVPGALSGGFAASWIGACGAWVALGLTAVPAAAAYGLLLSRVHPQRFVYVPCIGLAWGVVEISWQTWFPQFPWVALGASQIDTPVAPLASLVGVHGVSALMAAVSALIVQGIARTGARVIVASVLLVAACFTAGLWSGGRERGPGSERVRVALIQPGLPMSERRAAGFERRSLEILLEESEATEDVELIVWPENSFLSEPHGPMLAAVQDFVDRRGVLLLAGGRQRVESGWVTEALLFAPGAEHRVVYVKRRLLPLAEAVPAGLPPWLRRALGRLAPSLPMNPGSVPSTQRIGAWSIDLSICYEATFQRLDSDPESALLVNLVNDGWYDHTAGAAQHLGLVRWRAIETGQTLIRAASTGPSAIVGADGRIEARLDVAERGTLVRAVAASPERTPFEDYGNRPLTLLGVALAFFSVVLPCRAKG